MANTIDDYNRNVQDFKVHQEIMSMLSAYQIYDYDNGYMEESVLYLVMKETKTTMYVFGIAWIDNVTAENDVQTWYGADPTLF